MLPTGMPLSEKELSILKEALLVAPAQEQFSRHSETLTQLRVHSRCPCGCASISFISEEAEKSLETEVIADAMGLARNGELVGVMVWGTATQITSLRVHWPPKDPAPLPIAGSLRRWITGLPNGA